MTFFIVTAMTTANLTRRRMFTFTRGIGTTLDMPDNYYDRGRGTPLPVADDSTAARISVASIANLFTKHGR
jgi:hypothetical protein